MNRPIVKAATTWILLLMVPVCMVLLTGPWIISRFF
jgi:hypothetical protein